MLYSRAGRTVLLAAMVLMVATLTTSSIAPVSSATYYFRATSCHGLNFLPVSSATNYYLTGSARVALSSGVFTCDPNLPHKAIVTKVQFTVRDGTAVGDARNCALVRSSLDPISAGGFDVMASVPATSYSSSPGIVRLTDSTIDFQTVDLANHAYYAQCELFVGGVSAEYEVGIYGVDVLYKITPGNG